MGLSSLTQSGNMYVVSGNQIATYILHIHACAK